ncbi:MAG TPA: winged helix-turn-helix transcriptional regulator [Candidatus Nitrosotalea sp.]|nr:winged helix-turn-helix transcriptional regulator [Candidatus Nitrosotalea sp.]
MQRQNERNLEILTAIGEGVPVTQRALAEQLGVALGLANLCLKRLVSKGFIKVREFPAKPAARKRLQYVLTPKGVAEKTRLSYEYMAYSLRLFRRTRGNLRETMARFHAAGMKRFALCGLGEAAELAYLTLREFGLEPVGVFDGVPGDQFLGFPVRPLSELAAEEIDGVIVATFDRPEQRVAELSRLGVPTAKCLTLRRLAEPVAHAEERTGR